MKVTVDFSMCQGNGLCATAAPEVFELDASGVLLLHEEHVDGAREDQVHVAAAICPTQAIRVE